MINISRSLKFKLILCLIVLVIPLFAILIVNYQYSISLARKQVLDANKVSLSLYVNQLDSDLENVSNYILKISTVDIPDLSINDSDTRFFITDKIQSDLLRTIGFYSIVDVFYIYNVEYNEFTYSSGPKMNYMEEQKIEEYIKKQPNKVLAESPNKWSIVNIKGIYYLFYTLKINDIYFGSCINMSGISSGIDKIALQGKEFVALYSSDGNILYNHEMMNRYGFVFSDILSGSYSKINNEKYIFQASSLKRADINVSIVVKDKNVTAALSPMQKTIVIVSAMVIVIVLFYMLLFKRIIFNPLIKIKKAIGRIESGDLNYRLEHNLGSTEFQLISIALNSMTKEIKQLKIDVYEEQITKQEIELEYWYNQIKPHFYLNVINMINSLAQIREYAVIQEMSQYLSTYIRYMFKRHNGMATLKNELEHVKNYLNIQKMRFPDSISCRMNVESRLLNIEIPTLIIQTFVENIMRHAFDMYNHTDILISAYPDNENEELLHLTVHDNGKGFSDREIKNIMSDSDPSKEGKHIGIWNIKRRLRLIYGNRAKLIVRNNNGAQIEVILPYERDADR